MPTTEFDLHHDTPEEMEFEIGEQIKRYRINKLALDQKSLAMRAGVSERTLRNLEMGNGSSLRSYLRVVRAMGRYPWVLAVVPDVATKVFVVRKIKQRQRVYKPKTESSEN
ncbi:XRE family transcriptional regulator [Herbaspirillum sp. C9C3]|uniref:helix-turn-helix domain-containing protein n=1 Tax=Herbaspirillum sp. C9C3 TaxID=2735271 RepID=UPI0015858FB0|nr:XRE family transcriptional regulator [Herbaspirillum sp. C9C3]NUT60754.1 XRE family transcriptional regulator [Herbaspirillum sp. C9C3]